MIWEDVETKTKVEILRKIRYKKIRRGPKLEGYAFANFGYSSGTDGESRQEMKN